MKKLILALASIMAFNAQAAVIICDMQKDTGNKMILAQINKEEYAIYRTSFYATQTITVDGSDYKASRLEGDFKVITHNADQLLVKAKFGTRFALTGYYGTNTVNLNMKTLVGEYTNHVIPHLISDINAPQPEHTNVDQLKCRIVNQ